MFAKLALTTLLLVALAKAQQISELQNVLPTNQPNNQMQNQLPLNNQMQNQLPLNNQMQNQLPLNNQYQNQLPVNGQMQNLQPLNFLQSLREIPARGLHMLESVISNVRNMIPGMGRNGTQQNGRLPLNQMNGQMNGQTNLQGQNGFQLPNLPGPLGRLTDSLSQGRLPNPSELTQGLTNSLGQLTQGLNGNSARGSGQSSPLGTAAWNGIVNPQV